MPGHLPLTDKIVLSNQWLLLLSNQSTRLELLRVQYTLFLLQDVWFIPVSPPSGPYKAVYTAAADEFQ